MHRNVLENIVGKDNLFVVDMAPEGERIQRNNYIAFGKYSSKIERIKRNLQGNIYLFSNRIIEEICEIIQKEKIDFVFVDDSTFGKMVQTIKKKFLKVSVVSFYHDVKAELYLQWSRQGRIIDKIEYAIGLRNEKLNAKCADKNIVLNATEAEFYINIIKRRLIIICLYVCLEIKLRVRLIHIKIYKKDISFLSEPHIIRIYKG